MSLFPRFRVPSQTIRHALSTNTVTVSRRWTDAVRDSEIQQPVRSSAKKKHHVSTCHASAAGDAIACFIKYFVVVDGAKRAVRAPVYLGVIAVSAVPHCSQQFGSTNNGRRSSTGCKRYVDTLGGRMQVRRYRTEAATPFEHMAYFAEFLNLMGLYRRWVESCPLRYKSPNRALCVGRPRRSPYPRR